MQGKHQQSNQLVCEKIQFSELCKVFDAIKAAPKDRKSGMFKQFIAKWHQQLEQTNPDGTREFRSDDSFFDALRLFIPGKDERKFGMKEAKFSKLVCDVLMTKPLASTSTATEILVERLVQKVCESLSVQSPSVSIRQVNNMLDRMKYPSERRHQEKVMSELFRNCTGAELRWIFHIILDNMEKALGGLSSATVLRWFHKDAVDAFMSGDNLQQICENFVGEESGANLLAANGHIIGKAFRPMLLKRLNFDKYCLPKIIKFCRRPFYLELKYDGEHLLVHRYNFTQYKYFTRNGIDYTHKMGADSGTKISSRIHPFIRSDIREFVLDCELLLWDQKIQAFVGKNKRASDGKVYDVKHLDDDYLKNHSHLQRSLAVFDILYLDGKSLIDVPLVERVKILQKLFKDEDNSVVFVSKKQLAQTAKEFADFYRSAMRNDEEGIVVKGLDSLYRPGSRAERNGWFKIKPDYGVQSVLDLAVVGIRYENGALKHIKSFLVAARIPNPNNDNLHFKIVAGITSRLKQLDFQRLIKLLGEEHPLMDTMPDWLSNGKPGKFDRFVDKHNIHVVEVRASGLLNGILQFPSIVSIRNDKLVKEVDTLDDVLRFDERLRSRPVITETDPSEAAVLLNRKKKQNLKLKESCQLVKDDGTLEATISNALKGRKVCILNGGSGVTAQDLQKIVISLGATPISSPGKIADFLIAMDKRPINCVAAIKSDNYHIVSGNWLLRCKEKDALLKWEESDMIHKSSNAPFDLFSLPCEIGVEEEKERIDEHPTDQPDEEEQMDDDESDELVKEADRAMLEEEKICEEVEQLMLGRDCEPVERGNLFADFVFFIHESVSTRNNAATVVQLREKIEAQNGRISDKLDATVTHVVIDYISPDQSDELFTWNEKHRQWAGQFVSLDWIEQAIAEEDRYRVDERLHTWIR